MEEKNRVFPLNGNFWTIFSTQWKFFEPFFHSMETGRRSGILPSRIDTGPVLRWAL